MFIFFNYKPDGAVFCFLIVFNSWFIELKMTKWQVHFKMNHTFFIRYANESLGHFLKMCKTGQKCLKIFWKSIEWNTKFPKIRKCHKYFHACSSETCTIISQCIKYSPLFNHYTHCTTVCCYKTGSLLAAYESCWASRHAS